MARARGDFTRILVRKGIISSEQLLEARRLQEQTAGKLQDAIVKLGYAGAEQVTKAVAEFHGLEFIDLSEVTIPQAVVELLPESVARENLVLPLAQEGGACKIVLSEPTDSDTIQRLQFILNQEIVPVLATREQIIEAINRHYGLADDAADVGVLLQEFTDTSIEFEAEPTAADAEADDDSPVARLVRLFIQEAVAVRSGEIHFEPFADRVRVRYPIDGVLVERDSPPRVLLDPILSRIKALAKIDPPRRPEPRVGRIKRLLAPLRTLRMKAALTTGQAARICRLSRPTIIRCFDRGEIQGFRVPGLGLRRIPREALYRFMRVNGIPTAALERAETIVPAEPAAPVRERPEPTNGRTKVVVQNVPFDLGVRILPTQHGESAVLRIARRHGLDELGLAPEDLQLLRQFLQRRSGLILMTGPAGSGKTTTLYAALSELNRPDRKIITIEDPVEYPIAGVAQCQVRDGLSFTDTLRSVVQQDSAVIAVGEIRDGETARAAVDAALGGRLVLATLASWCRST